MMNQKIIAFIFLLVSTIVSGQQQGIETTIDTTRNKIGAQFNLTLRTNVDTLSNVTFPNAERFGPMEVIRNYVVDTVKKDNRYELVKRYGLAQFDSGRYTIPALKVAVNNRVLFSQPITVDVSNVAVDTLKQKMYDIKPIIPAKSSSLPAIVEYILIFLLIIGIAALIYWLVKRNQIKRAETAHLKSPIERATSLLQNLEKKELWQKGEVKAYYSELTDIARNYIEEAIHIPAMESTTSELVAELRSTSVKRKMSVSPEILLNLEKVLMQADLVKFAKSKPLDFEIADDRNKIESAIETLDKSIPDEPGEDRAMLELERKKLLKQQKLKRVLITIGAAFLLLIATAGYFIATRGYDFVKDNLIGHPTKDLLEGEWIFSEYGNPRIGIETPRVLKRTDAEKFLPKEAMALLKEFQMFSYGSVLDNFNIMLSTKTFKQEVEIDLNVTMEEILKILELQGATNILAKQEEFQTKQGITGIKSFGTMTITDPIRNESKKMYYEILLFSQQNGLQQIMVSHEETDQNGKQILERVLNSVELKIQNP